MESENYIWQQNYNHPVAWNQSFRPMSLPEMLIASVSAHPNASMIDFMGRKYTYAQVLAGARRVACGLLAMGVKRGDRIGLYLPNVPHYVAAYYGIMLIGATAVNFSPLYTVDELAHQVEDSGTSILFTVSAKALLPNALAVLNQSSLQHLVVGSIAGGLPIGKSLLYRVFHGDEAVERPDDPRVTAFSALIANDGICPPVQIDPLNDVALLQYTGGTTGTPKGAMLTHQNLTANARQTAMIDPNVSESDRIIGVLPLFHVFANTCVLNRTISTAGEIIMLPRFNAEQVLEAVERTRATALPGVPTMFQALIDHPKIRTTDCSSLRACVSGGAPLPLSVKEKFEQLTGARVIEGYGLTESSGAVSSNPYISTNRTGTIGQPLPGTRVKLVDREDPSRPAPAGEPGEIVFAGPQVMRGYWQRPDADAEVFIGEFLRTGDVGIIEADGYIRVVDRLKDMIAVGGFKVFPSQIETILYRHPDVREAIVIGIPDSYLGEKPKAFVSLQAGATITGDALKEWANAHLGKHERLCDVAIRAELPKTLVGKLSRKELVAEEKARAQEAPHPQP